MYLIDRLEIENGASASMKAGTPVSLDFSSKLICEPHVPVTDEYHGAHQHG